MRDVAAKTNNMKQNAVKSVGARRRIRLWTCFMVLFVGWAGYTYIAQSGEIGNKSLQLSERQASKEANEQTLNQLKYELNRLKDPEYIGQIAMKKYGLYKPGEIPVRISESDS
ncbi:septum formation initiator family protein [Paenibacillus sp. Marseille-P2973]|uniref:FtsB family cell division protein n=1 Tax=Paenibacillus sp. Marseille-P2973 TaxID=1871032 RepID=UPI001B37FA69|nr:septum formation initiator family protein [Paenibacillus sp. Marseille-P2973]MBQ4901658.1 septum formation initiator family protein [Paenibacillus sp. Marseille-P2973]